MSYLSGLATLLLTTSFFILTGDLGRSQYEGVNGGAAEPDGPALGVPGAAALLLGLDGPGCGD